MKVNLIFLIRSIIIIFLFIYFFFVQAFHFIIRIVSYTESLCFTLLFLYINVRDI
jgi:hypothetical protein